MPQTAVVRHSFSPSLRPHIDLQDGDCN